MTNIPDTFLTARPRARASSSNTLEPLISPQTSHHAITRTTKIQLVVGTTT